jgi:transcriptional regulator with XRE-family HTH domain
MRIGNHIKKIRELRDYTQTYMSVELEISLSAYSKLERDETDISLKRLEQIAKILNVSVNEIIQFDEHAFLDNPKTSPIHVEKTQQNDSLIDQMRNEIDFLRSLIQNNKHLGK